MIHDGYTPWREVTVTLDSAEPGHSEPYYARQRDRFAIKMEEVDSVEQLASGAIGLKPNETDLSFLHETTAGQGSIIRLPDVEAIPLLQEVPMQRQYPELPLLSPGASVSSTGDHFLLKRVPAGSNWNSILSSPLGSPTLSPTPRYPMDRIAEGKVGPGGAYPGIDPADQGYVIRFVAPNVPVGFADYLWTFMFGGIMTPAGFGLFALTLGGAGKAKLHEWIGPEATGGWELVDEWVWAPAELIPGRMHAVRLIPHCSKWLEVRSSVTDTARPGGRMTAHRPTGLHGQEVKPHAHLYEAKNRQAIAVPPAGLAWPVTGQGRFRFDARRDLRFPFQIARITYPATGSFEEPPFRVPNTPGTSHVVELVLRAIAHKRLTDSAPLGEVVPEPIDTTTDMSLAPDTETYSEGGVSKTISGYETPPAPNAMKVRLVLSTLLGTTHVTPYLLGYEVRRRGEFATPAASPITISDSHRVQSPVTRLEIDQGDQDPTHARATLRIADLTNRLTRVRARGEMPIKIETTYDRLDQTKKAVIFEGTIVKPVATLRGNLTGVAYPSPDWHELRLECAGKHHRISKRDWPKQVLSFAWDPNGPVDPDTGGRKPWKVTDAARLLMQTAGVPDDMLIIPDLPMRFWSNGDPDQEHLQISVGTPILEFVQLVLHDYLNYFLVWDANALSAGAWRVLPAPSSSDPVLWNYQADGPGAGKLAHHPGSYAADTTFMDEWESWPVAPLGNWLQVTAGQGNSDGKHYTVQVRNPLSYDRPGDSAASDVEDPDYLGYLSPLYRRIDGRLTTPEAAKFVARVTFERVCRGQRFGRLLSPAVLVAPNEASVYTTNTHRPHLYGDHVTIDSGDGPEDWFVLSCHWDVHKKHMMTQVLEVMKFNDPLSYS
jgi:hypothetical protein